ncbi:MAG: Lrp/AsnC ligand binding domain-containing protein [Candidatus Korarchaeota archaeon]
MPVKAYVLVNVEIGKEHEIKEKILQIPGVKEAHVTYGDWDIIIRAIVDRLSGLDELVGKVRMIKGVTHTSTLVAIREEDVE